MIAGNGRTLPRLLVPSVEEFQQFQPGFSTIGDGRYVFFTFHEGESTEGGRGELGHWNFAKVLVFLVVPRLLQSDPINDLSEVFRGHAAR